MNLKQDDDFIYVYEDGILKIKVQKTIKSIEEKPDQDVPEQDFSKIIIVILLATLYLALFIAILITYI